jgi:hypothetical protein
MVVLKPGGTVVVVVVIKDVGVVRADMGRIRF